MVSHRLFRERSLTEERPVEQRETTALRNEIWLVALALSLGPAVSNGMARFAYALILPAMRADLGWTYTQAGWLNTMNALGYLCGALMVFRLAGRVETRTLFNHAMWLTAAALILSGLTARFIDLLVLRFFAGVTGAIVFICGGILVAHVAAHAKHAAAPIALYFAGGGIGLFVSGVTLPWLFEIWGNQAWGSAWIGMGVASVGACALTSWGARRIPPSTEKARAARWSKRLFLPLLASYFLFALGYIAYMTFIVAWMRDHGGSAAQVALVWGTLGLATIVSPWPWRHALTHWSGGRAMAASLAVVALGAALPLVQTSLVMMMLSALFFGGAFFIPPAIGTAVFRKGLPPAVWGKAVAGFTLIFAAGQIVGPVLTGALSDATGSLFAGLALSVAILAVAALVALAQKDIRNSDAHFAI
jgi:predicted MFS family arabinose efflux permease